MSNGLRLESRLPTGRAVVATNAIRIERDFRGLVEALGHSIEMLDPSDQELRERLTNTKAAAERGHRLSKLLLKSIRRRQA